MSKKQKILSWLGSLLIALTFLVPATFAETPLPDGAVKGLPERLAALDDEGNPVNSATGEYFFHVEDMTPGETYTKKIQLVNLREDQTYHIYFCVEPLHKSGSIDLEAGCTCRFYLDDELFYTGNVNGDGNLDLTQYYDCGSFFPGKSRTLRCEIVWNELNVQQAIDNGWRLVDQNGVHVLKDPDGEGYVYGEIEFKWIFCARVEAQEPDDTGSGDGGGDTPPHTGILLQDGSVWLIAMGVVAVLIAVLLVLIKKQKKDQRK